VQNELVLAALKTATDHLTAGGTFCTKVYRSTDYNALIWVFQQLFEDVQAIKPNSSRSQSSEIFIVCLKYTAPHRIDPKLLDPNHVFKEVVDPGLQSVDVLHKKYDKLNKRHRTGYDDGVGVVLRNIATVTDFVESKEPVRMLTDINEFRWSDECQMYKENRLTTKEILECFKDLRVLGKIDFKKILKWRQHMIDQNASLAAEAESGALKEGGGDEGEGGKQRAGRHKQLDTEEAIQEEIMQMRAQAALSNRREKKKSRLAASKERQRQALGMTNNAFGAAEDMELFSLSASMEPSRMEDIDDVDLEDENAAEWMDEEGANEDGEDGNGLIMVEDDLEGELEDQYMRYVTGRKKSDQAHRSDASNDLTEEGRTITAKRARLARSAGSILSSQNEEDASLLAPRRKSDVVRGDLAAYVKVLSGKADKKPRDDGREDEDADSSDDSDDDEEEQDDDRMEEDDDNEDDEDDDEDEHSGGGGKRRAIVTTDRLPKSARIDKWFSHPIFKESLVEEGTGKGGKGSERMSAKAQEAISQMPKTDREIRKEKRKKVNERLQRRDQKKALAGSVEGLNDLDMPSHTTSFDDDDDDEAELSAETKEKRELIRQGLGKAGSSSSSSSGKAKSKQGDFSKGGGDVGDGRFEIVPAEDDSGLFPSRADDRNYDSDNEVYDAHDRAMTLALGTLMLRRSRQKALVDASYNRFAWNDPKELPSWFLDDEMKHNKPQLPVPAALLEQIKSRFQTTGTKEIKKVAEARMRKRKRAMVKLKSAKKQATMMAENSEMSEKQKIKAISRAMRTAKVAKTDKVYVVTKKSGNASVGTKGAGKGKLKFVDKVMKKEKRAERSRKKRGKK